MKPSIPMKNNNTLLKYFTIGVLLTIITISVVNAGIPIPFYEAILNPPNIHERIRIQEIESMTLDQWWYYWLRDTELNRHYAFTYAISLCKDRVANNNKDCKYDGVFILFSCVDHTINKTFQKVEHYEYKDLEIVNDGSYFHLKVLNPLQRNQTLYEIQPLKDGLYQISGNLRKNSPNEWFQTNTDSSLEAQWNFTIDRIYGYYGQKQMEKPDEHFKGIIQWNTYSHSSQVSGLLTYQSNSIQNTIIQTIHDKRYRFYCDMNWGTNLPDAPPHDNGDKRYAWGWYYVNIPSNNIQNELSIIAGSGRTYANFPLYTLDALFGDIRLNSTHHIELTQIVAYSETFYYTNDGKVLQFKVDRSEWTTVKDSLGEADIPLRQVLTMETTNYLVVMDFKSKWTDYNRLIFPLKAKLFSDFEALGVSSHLKIVYKPTNQILYDVDISTTTGLEFGYGIDVNFPTRRGSKINLL
ncbi:hypothetical protein ABK040_015589 [Willaertia magna]